MRPPNRRSVPAPRRRRPQIRGNSNVRRRQNDPPCPRSVSICSRWRFPWCPWPMRLPWHRACPNRCTILDTVVAPGESRRFSWSATELFEGVPVSTPVLVVNGELPGPTLCLTAAVHGDELNGIEMVRRVMHELDPNRRKLSGAVIGVPIVNVQGFRRGSRYLPDRRDLNRFFPGNPRGSAASRIAHAFFTQIVAHCGALVDLHTGSFERANLPQLRADLRNPDVLTLTEGFGSTVILHSTPTAGTLRYAATNAGIPDGNPGGRRSIGA